MQRWNDFYDQMDPHKKDPIPKPEIDVTRSATVRYFSVYPRKRDNAGSARGQTTPVAGDDNLPHSSNQRHTVTADQSIVSGDRYTARPHEFGPNLNRSDNGGHTNYAWVD